MGSKAKVNNNRIDVIRPTNEKKEKKENIFHTFFKKILDCQNIILIVLNIFYIAFMFIMSYLIIDVKSFEFANRYFAYENSILEFEKFAYPAIFIFSILNIVINLIYTYKLRNKTKLLKYIGIFTFIQIIQTITIYIYYHFNAKIYCMCLNVAVPSSIAIIYALGSFIKFLVIKINKKIKNVHEVNVKMASIAKLTRKTLVFDKKDNKYIKQTKEEKNKQKQEFKQKQKDFDQKQKQEVKENKKQRKIKKKEFKKQIKLENKQAPKRKLTLYEIFSIVFISLMVLLACSNIYYVIKNATFEVFVLSSLIDLIFILLFAIHNYAPENEEKIKEQTKKQKTKAKINEALGRNNKKATIVTNICFVIITILFICYIYFGIRYVVIDTKAYKLEKTYTDFKKSYENIQVENIQKLILYKDGDSYGYLSEDATPVNDNKYINASSFYVLDEINYKNAYAFVEDEQGFYVIDANFNKYEIPDVVKYVISLEYEKQGYEKQKAQRMATTLFGETLLLDLNRFEYLKWQILPEERYVEAIYDTPKIRLEVTPADSTFKNCLFVDRTNNDEQITIPFKYERGKYTIYELPFKTIYIVEANSDENSLIDQDANYFPIKNNMELISQIDGKYLFKVNSFNTAGNKFKSEFTYEIYDLAMNKIDEKTFIDVIGDNVYIYEDGKMNVYDLYMNLKYTYDKVYTTKDTYTKIN